MERRDKAARNLRVGRPDFLPAYFESDHVEIEPIKLLRVAHESAVAVLANIREDACGHTLGLGQAHRPAAQKPFEGSTVRAANDF